MKITTSRRISFTDVCTAMASIRSPNAMHMPGMVPLHKIENTNARSSSATSPADANRNSARTGARSTGASRDDGGVFPPSFLEVSAASPPSASIIVVMFVALEPDRTTLRSTN